tara:strand:- start:20 stop:241 length:222 start_codon:yes stop_codon:yes gene_type:complete
MIKILLVLALLFNGGCTLLVANKTVKTIDELLETTPNPDKKKEIIEKQKTLKEKSREFYCSKVKDAEKCGNVQ